MMSVYLKQPLSVMVLCMAFLIGLSQVTAFQCQSCSYSYSEDNPEKDTACIYKPEIYTGWSVLKCSDYCVVQEIYSKEKQRVVAYWRSCSDKADTGYCRGDTWLLTCFHSCQGDNCNSWVRGQLHGIYGDIPPPESGNGAVSTMTSQSPLLFSLIMHVLICSLTMMFLFSDDYNIEMIP